MIQLGTFALIIWASNPELHNCVGKLKAKESAEGLKAALTLLVDVKCPNGTQFEYVAGVPESKLAPTSSGD